MGALAGAGGIVKGVESVEGVKDPVQVAKDLARKSNTVVAITGKRDILSDGTRVLGVDNGHVMLQTITGTGCMATTVVAMFCALERDYLVAATAALACYGLAAQRAARRAKGPGAFRAALLDALYQLTPAQVRTGARVVELE
jgi:hydroxyethylthiazole kinase